MSKSAAAAEQAAGNGFLGESWRAWIALGDNLITSDVHVGAAALRVSAGWRGTLSALGAGYLALGVPSRRCGC